MGCNVLSHTLLDLGFLYVLGSTEQEGCIPKYVASGIPYTTDHNNGVVAVYDELGRPWVIAMSTLDKAREVPLVLNPVRPEDRRVHPVLERRGHFARQVFPRMVVITPPRS